jgi:hypothetical protein
VSLRPFKNHNLHLHLTKVVLFLFIFRSNLFFSYYVLLAMYILGISISFLHYVVVEVP